MTIKLKPITSSDDWEIKSDIVIYKTKKDEDVKLPYQGKCVSIGDDYVTFEHTPSESCKFFTKIKKIQPTVTENSIYNSSYVIGKSNEEQVEMSVQKRKGGGLLEPGPYLTGSAECTTKEKNEKENEKYDKNIEKRSDLIYDPFKIAAWPFQLTSLGGKGVKSILGMKEEVERIKKLMK
jgi:hypothetical protein